MSKPAPSSLRARGRRFWRATVTAYELSDHELQLLAEACGVLDLIDVLVAAVERDGPLSSGSRGQSVTSPAVVELRLQRQLLSRLLIALALPQPEDAPPERPGTFTTASESSRSAALRRWHGNR